MRKFSNTLRNAVLLAFMLLSTGAMLAQTSITSITSLSQITSSTGNYKITTNISGGTAGVTSFSGTLEAAIDPDTKMPYKISGLSAPLFQELTGTVKNLVLDNVSISSGDDDGNTGAIACVANGGARIYNIGILSGSVGGSGNVGGIVGLLGGTARVINCYSYADITSGGSASGTYCAGLVGNNSQTSNQTTINTIVVNCMFYGEISTTACSNFAPVYGNNMIKTDATNGINPYCYFLSTAEFQKSFTTNINQYNRSWPADPEYLTRFEYYRSILNSNRQLMAWWVNGNIADTALILKWVLDPSIAPYPILKKWGFYPSIINPDDTRTWDPEANSGNGAWQTRSTAAPYRGKSFGTLSITVNPGSHAASGVNPTTITPTITDMDTLNYDYGYYKVQLPYYNELFGDNTSSNHDTRFGGNYKDYVVTGWKITKVNGSSSGTTTFVKNWESGYNFADRADKFRDLYSVSERVYAQGGYYYVPEDVTSIEIEAYWGKAVYLHNTGHYIDRVNLTTAASTDGNLKTGNPFSPAGTLPNTFTAQNYPVKDVWNDAVKALDAASEVTVGGIKQLNKTVYDQAIVLLSNVQIRNANNNVSYSIDNKWHPYTIMSIDWDIDNEPDYCFEFQFRQEFGRPGMQPIRFDFLPVPELGMAVRHNQNQHTIGIFIPQGHFEITETSWMHTTQFEYDFDGTKIEAPVILNGGHFEQIVVRKGNNNRTSYFLMGGHFRMLRFTPGRHTNKDSDSKKTRHCAVNAIGGDYPEFYLSGIYNLNVGVDNDNPHCYTNGGKFGIIAGAGYEPINGNVTFKIDHSVIREFYGGGINGSKPITGSIDVTVNNSLVDKYCGGPKVGVMSDGKTVTTNATNTYFRRFYGGGNGGTSYYREQKQDGNVALPAATAAGWADYGYKTFNPLNTLSVTKTYEGPNTTLNRGYHALFEFECFVESNGLGGKPTVRSYIHWAQFGTTKTGNVTNILNDCIVENDFFGGGNLGNVEGTVTSTLTGCTVYGNAFGGGYSGNIEPFRIHDKSATVFPSIDLAGIMQNPKGKFEYVKNADNSDRYYTWCYKNAAGQMFPNGVTIPSTATTNNPTFQNAADGNWYVLTTVSLEGLGAVSQDATITLVNTTVGTLVGSALKPGTGDVYGGGNESSVNGNATVNLEGTTTVRGNVFGGGNKASVVGNTNVNIQNTP